MSHQKVKIELRDQKVVDLYKSQDKTTIASISEQTGIHSITVSRILSRHGVREKKPFRQKCICHPDRKHYAKGLCHSCYIEQYREKQEPKEERRLCGRCNAQVFWRETQQDWFCTSCRWIGHGK